MTRTLTAKEITDILFQKPERITADILSALKPLQKAEIALARPRKPSERGAYSPRSYEEYSIPLALRLRLTFDQYSRARLPIKAQEDSFLNARKELKALGLSHRQIGFIFDRIDTLLTEIIEMQIKEKDIHFRWIEDDRVYLGKTIPSDHHGDQHDNGYISYYKKFPKDANELYPIVTKHFECEITSFPEAYSYKKHECNVPSPK